MTVILLIFAAHWYVSRFCPTFVLRRDASHRTVTMNATTAKACFVVPSIFQCSKYLSPYGYGVMHRMRHAFADTENDPHSPKYDETIWNMMWKTKTIYSAIANRKIVIEKRSTQGGPQWDAFDKFARSWPSWPVWAAA